MATGAEEDPWAGAITSIGVLADAISTAHSAFSLDVNDKVVVTLNKGFCIKSS